MKFKAAYGLGIAALALCVAACSSDDANSSNGAPIAEEVTEDGMYIDSTTYYELTYNYTLLSAYYFDANSNQALKQDVNSFYGVHFEPDSTKGICTASFSDVCGLYNQVDDLYTRYYDPFNAATAMKMYEPANTHTGIGANFIINENGSYEFDEIYTNAPAQKAGLSVGDIVVSVNDNPPESEGGLASIENLSKGDTIVFVVNRDGLEFPVNVILDEFQEPTVHLVKRDGIPVIIITRFNSNTPNANGTYGEYKEVLDKIKADKSVNSIIVDVRDNPGGNTEHCSSIASEFLSKGDTTYKKITAAADSSIDASRYVITQKFDTLTYVTQKDGSGKKYYYVFLANERTASCAELLLSAVTNTRSFPVVGKTTYGKGIGQTVSETFAGGIAIITSSHTIDKNNVSYHKYGIAPDYEISDPNEQLIKAIELAKEGTAQRTAGYGTANTGNFKKAQTGTFTPGDLLAEMGMYTYIPYKK